MLDDPDDAPAVARRIEWIDPEDLFRAGPGRAPHAFWLDAGPNATSGWSWLGCGDRADALPRGVPLTSARIAGVPGGFGGGWVGWLGYDGGARRAGAPSRPDPAAPDEVALSVSRLVAFDHARREAWLIAPEGDETSARHELEGWRVRAGVLPPRSGHPAPTRGAAVARHGPDQYAALIDRCRDAIRAGDAYQLCLTTRFVVAGPDGPDGPVDPVDPVDAYLRLRHALPAHHGGWIRSGPFALLSASPEEFLRVRGGVVRTRPIKGTRARGADEVADAAAVADLVSSPKERAENVMIVDLMRNDLQRVCAPGTVTVERLLEVESFAAVHQLVSTVAGRLLPGVTLGDLLDAAFPAGSMTGAPKLSAMTVLHGLEGGPRGVYAGCFGRLGRDGSLDLAMTIRSIVLHPGGAFVGAGGGITWLSDAAEEVAEVALKARGPLAALGAVLPDAWARPRPDAGAVGVGGAVPPVR